MMPNRLLSFLGTLFLLVSNGIAIVYIIGSIKEAEPSSYLSEKALDIDTKAEKTKRIISSDTRDFSAITQRPLFSPERKPYVPPPEEVIAPKPILETSSPTIETVPDLPISNEKSTQKPEITLLGIMIIDSNKKALMKVNGAKTEWLTIADIIDGWAIASISDAAVTLELKQKKIVVELYK